MTETELIEVGARAIRTRFGAERGGELLAAASTEMLLTAVAAMILAERQDSIVARIDVVSTDPDRFVFQLRRALTERSRRETEPRWPRAEAPPPEWPTGPTASPLPPPVEDGEDGED